MNNNFFKFLIFTIILTILSFSCAKKKMDPNRPITAEDKRLKNIEEGRGASLKTIFGRDGATNYEFSTSNPMWRATLETLDFLPLTTVDYSGGIVITDWYSGDNAGESVKITDRFLSNEIRSNSLKVIVHRKICDSNLKCKTNISSNSAIKEELHSTILKKAALFQKSDKKKK